MTKEIRFQLAGGKHADSPLLTVKVQSCGFEFEISVDEVDVSDEQSLSIVLFAPPFPLPPPQLLGDCIRQFVCFGLGCLSEDHKLGCRWNS